MNKYNWERINFPSNKDDWKKYKKKQCSNCSYVTMLKVKKYTYAYVSKHNSNCEK